MDERKGLTKKQRFEVFKRDGFTCQYCGRRPPDVVLVVDHINPVANGGDNELINLITSCNDCNAGKGKIQLSDIKPMPDANIETMALYQETAELNLYLSVKEMRDEARAKVIEVLREHWCVSFNTSYYPVDSYWIKWLSIASPALLEEAITKGARKPEMLGDTSRFEPVKVIKWVSGILWRLIEMGGK